MSKPASPQTSIELSPSSSPLSLSPREEGTPVELTQVNKTKSEKKETIFLPEEECSSKRPASFTEYDEEEEWISIKLDSTIFTAPRSTLTIDKESVLCVMFQPGSPYYLPQDLSHPSKPYMLDRNPKYFEPILNYLRTGELIMDAGINPKGVWLEAKYFNVQDVVEELEAIIQKQEAEQVKNEAELSREDVVKALIQSTSTTRLRFQGINMCGIDLAKLDLSGVNFSRSNLQKANFSNSNLELADLKKCTMMNANLTGAKLVKSRLCRSKLNNTNFTNANLTEADLSFCDLSNVCLRYADLGCANLTGALLHNADLTGANLKKAILKGAVLTGVDRASTNLPMGGVIGR